MCSPLNSKGALQPCRFILVCSDCSLYIIHKCSCASGSNVCEDDTVAHPLFLNPFPSDFHVNEPLTKDHPIFYHHFCWTFRCLKRGIPLYRDMYSGCECDSSSRHGPKHHYVYISIYICATPVLHMCSWLDEVTAQKNKIIFCWIKCDTYTNDTWFLIVFAHMCTPAKTTKYPKNINSAKIACNIRTHTKPEMTLLK